jgi:hypothetical protein
MMGLINLMLGFIGLTGLVEFWVGSYGTWQEARQDKTRRLTHTHYLLMSVERPFLAVLMGFCWFKQG